MDRFTDYLETVDCSDTGVTLSFSNQTSYQTAKDAWTWVGDALMNNYIMVVEGGYCGPTRQPYQVVDIDFDDSSMSASMTGYPQAWIEAFPGYNLHINSQGLIPSNSSLSKRLTGSADLSIDLTHNFDGTLFSKTVDDVTFELDCVNCGTAGSFHFDVNIVPIVIPLPPHITGTVSLTSSGVAATLELGLKVSSSLQSPITEQFNSPDIQLPGGIVIKDIATLGPILTFGIAASLDTFTAQAELDFGTEMTIPDSSIATLDFTNSQNNEFRGFNPSFSKIGPTLDASVSATASLTPTIAIGLDVSIDVPGIKQIGASAGLALHAPVLDLSLEADANSADGVCGNPDATLGVQFGVGLEASLDAFAGFEPIASVPNQVAILSTSTQLFSTCLTIAGATPTPSSAPSSTVAASNVQPTAFSDSCCGTGCSSAAGFTTEFPFNISNDGIGCQATGPSGLAGAGITSLEIVTNSACTANFFSDDECCVLVTSQTFGGFACFTTQSGVAAGVVLTQDQAEAALFMTLKC
jgi:hypothetical protein